MNDSNQVSIFVPDYEIDSYPIEFFFFIGMYDRHCYNIKHTQWKLIEQLGVINNFVKK